MNQTPAAARPSLVLIGAGHSQIEVLRQFGMNPEPGLRATLISRDYHAPYSGMLPGLIAGHYTFEEAHISVVPLARFAGVRFIHAEAERIDLGERLVHCVGRPPVPFDTLSINTGSRPAAIGIPGAAEFATPAKPVDEFLTRWAGIVERAAAAQGPFHIVTVGGGAGGVELTLSMQHRLRRERETLGKDPGAMRFTIVNAASVPLATHNSRVRQKMERVLSARGVEVRNGTRATAVTEGRLEIDSGGAIPFDELIWVTDAAPQPWIAGCGLAADERGFIEVDESLRSTSHPFVFATGDGAFMRHAPRPKSGVFAVRQGPYLAANLRRALRGEALERYTPQRQFLSLISTGDANAILSRGPFCLEGGWAWKWKDRIDRAFMDKYNALSPGAMDDSGGMDPMRCGGCGCKIGADALSAALRRVKQRERPGIVVGLDAPDDAAVVEIPSGMLAVQSVDFFRAFIDDPYVLGKITAHHCLSDVYAMGATPHTALAIATLPYSTADEAGDTLGDLLQGATEVLDEAGATLVGGHTTEGPELAFGLSVHGYAAPGQLLRKGGIRPGDLLILTKPVGTGVIFAAGMRGAARGAWIDGAIGSMLRGNGPAVEIFRRHGAAACTDVTGFGLAVHLGEMARASNRDVRIDLDAVPLLEGALQLSGAGVRSTLYPENAGRGRSFGLEPGEHPAYALLFDPQTAGGLLASVPAANAARCVEDLRSAGYASAAAIGSALDGTRGMVCVELHDLVPVSG